MTELRPRLADALAGRYRIERELGRGGMAVVFLAYDPRHERAVALKVLRPELGAALGPERFLREIKLAAGLTHPHIVPLFESGEANGMLYYVMPYIPGESLRQRLQRDTRIPLTDALQITREVADALAYAHRANIVHRDIKPENILLESGHAVVSDFGVARAISAAVPRVTVAGLVVGTPDYMSPEQATDEGELDGRSDVFSLGCVLYEMLVGRPLRGAIAPRASLGAAMTQTAGIPPDVLRLITTAIAERPDDRFPSAEAFGAAIDGVLRRRGGGDRLRWARWAAMAAVVTMATLVWRVVANGGGGPEERDVLASATTSSVALAEMHRGKNLLWAFDFDGAAAAYHRAIAADSDAALAYHRLSVVETWRWDYPAALQAVVAGLARADRISPKWRELLRAQRYYTMRKADSAIVAFQGLVADYPALPDAWYGLSEALYHFAGFADNRPQDAELALRRLLSADSTFAPLWEHLADLALYRGDAAEARRAFAHMHPDDRDRPGQEAALVLTFGDAAARARMFAILRDAERTRISLIAAVFGHAAFRLSTVDSAAALLVSAGRTHEDRVRGAQYRFVVLAAQNRWADALNAWTSGQGKMTPPAFDRWIVQAAFAGWPSEDLAEPMLARVRAEARTAGMPSVSLPPTDDGAEAFRALVHRAALAGDSAEVRWLLGLIAAAAESADPSDPMPPSLRAALDARLALLARDTSRALGLLETSVDRPAQPFMVFYPQLSMAPERMLLAELYGARGDSAAAWRWLDSFDRAWSFGDLLYATRVACIRRVIAAHRPLLTPTRRSSCP